MDCDEPSTIIMKQQPSYRKQLLLLSGYKNQPLTFYQPTDQPLLKHNSHMSNHHHHHHQQQQHNRTSVIGSNSNTSSASSSGSVSTGSNGNEPVTTPNDQQLQQQQRSGKVDRIDDDSPMIGVCVQQSPVVIH